MRAAHAWLLAGALMAVPLPSAAATAKQTGQPAAPPRLLNIVRVKLKPKTAATYASLENQIVRAYDRAKAKVYWICYQSPKDPTDVLYVNLADSPEAWDRTTATYTETMKRHPNILDLQQKLEALTASTTSTLSTRRDDVDRVSADVDFGTARSLRLTTVDVHPGREGDFLDAVRTAPTTSGSWIVYEANQGSTYSLMTLSRAARARAGAPSLPRSLRRTTKVLKKIDTKIYVVRPALSRRPPP